MTTHEKKTFVATYDWAKNWHDLPWSHEKPTLFLPQVCHERKPGRVLDIGCGAGTDSVFMARQGWAVTALDFVPKALEYTEQRAKEAGVKVTPVEADITEWQAPHGYDVVLDHGLLHNMDPVRHQAYRERLISAIGEDGDFILLHWHPRFPGQPNGKMGPRRVSRADIEAFFAPELQLRLFALEEFEDLPDMVGGGMSQAYYWFRRNQAHFRPAELLAQIRATLGRHSVDPRQPAQGTVAGELLARIVGPGRLGMSHRALTTEEALPALRAWAERSGENPREVEQLIRVFAAENLGNICTANPRCGECEVRICKRLRYR
jgi:SAM-dependent methyltransferase